MFTKKTPKNAKLYECKKCNFNCSKKSDWDRHIFTRKHINTYTYLQKNAINPSKIYICKNCDKAYSFRQSLYTHNKKCILPKNILLNEQKKIDEMGEIGEIGEIVEMVETNNEKHEIKILTNLVMQLVKSNSELKDGLMNNNASLINYSTIINNNSNTNSNNKTFNLQIFLNEQCKNAMNLSDFIESIKLQMSDLENIGTLGYTEGMNNIIFKEITDIDIFNRPFHCSDLKREIIYIKEGNKWEKEDSENKKLKNAIRSIEKKNFKLLNEWADQHPKINDYNSPDGDKYLKLLHHATSGDNEHMNKVIKKLAKNITIDKNV
jgi:hypothetical protein